MSPNVTGALMMMAGMICFTFNDMFIKLTNGALPLGQLLTLRGILSSVVIIALGLALGGIKLRLGRKAWSLIALRAVAEMMTAYFFLNALFNMPLANVRQLCRHCR